MFDIKSPGMRLKVTRNISGLSRKDLEKKYNINVNTVQSWELDRNPISKKGAERLCSAFANEGVIVSKSWLIDGIGLAPKLVRSNQEVVTLDAKSYDEEATILYEAETFKSLNPDPMVFTVSDDAMEPRFQMGDYVGANKRYKEDIQNLIGRACLIELYDKTSLFRILSKGDIPGTYTLICSNTNTQMVVPVMLNTKVASAGEVVWHRKRESN